MLSQGQATEFHQTDTTVPVVVVIQSIMTGVLLLVTASIAWSLRTTPNDVWSLVESTKQQSSVHYNECRDQLDIVSNKLDEAKRSLERFEVALQSFESRMTFLEDTVKILVRKETGEAMFMLDSRTDRDLTQKETTP